MLILPNLDRGLDEFYDPATGAIRPKYAWYRQGMGRLRTLAARVTEQGDSLAKDLERRSGGGVAAPLSPSR